MGTTVQDVMNALIQPVGPLKETVDLLLFGDPLAEVTGIATAFMPTQYVLEQMIASGANLLISHESVSYSHHHQPSYIEQDPVYQAKRRLIEESGIAVFRLHDYIHRYHPDGITTGWIEALDWQSRLEEHLPTASIMKLPGMTVQDIAAYVKDKLGIPYVRVVGDLAMTCERVGLLAGYRGNGSVSIPLYESANLDLIIAGEGPEWETPEYVRDAVHQGRRRALLIVGHAESEEWGMAALARQLQADYPAVPVHFLRDRPVFQVLV